MMKEDNKYDWIPFKPINKPDPGLHPPVFSPSNGVRLEGGSRQIEIRGE